MSLLRTTLLADGLACLIYGSGLAIAANSLAHLFANQSIFLFSYSLDNAIQLLGFVVIAIGLGVFAVSCTKQISAIAVSLIVAIEILWILGSVWFLAISGSALTSVGVGFVVLSAIAIFGFMVLEIVGLRKMKNVQTP